MTASELVEKVKNLAPAPHTALKLVALLDRPAVDNEEIVQVLKFDNVLTAKLLRACNSPFYGFSEPVASVEQAVLILGHQQILRLLFAIAFNSTMSLPLPGYAGEAKELWRHSLVTALACETLANDELPVEAESAVAFTAGLLHDMGKLALNQVLEEGAQQAIRLRIREYGQSWSEAEQQVIGTDHAEVGALLLQKWKLPEEIVEAAANHHHPVCKPRPRLSSVVHSADCLAHLMGSTFGWEAFAVRVDDNVADALHLTPAKVEEFLVSAHSSLAQADYLGKLT